MNGYRKKLCAVALCTALFIFVFGCWLYREYKISAQYLIQKPIYIFDWENKKYNVRHLRFLSKSRLFCATLVRNKAAFLKEWIHFYLNQGIDHIIIYNHNTTDVATTQLLVSEINQNQNMVTSITMIDAERSFERYCSHSIKNKGEHWFAWCQYDVFSHSLHTLRHWNPHAQDLWLACLDVDEYIWGRKQCLKAILFQLPLSTEVLFVVGYTFGTSGFHNNSEFDSVLSSHLWRAKDDFKNIRKYFTRVNSKNVLELWSVHSPNCGLGFTGILGLTDHYLCQWSILNETEIRFHHYQFFSNEEIATKLVQNHNQAYEKSMKHQSDTYNVVFDNTILNVNTSCLKK